VVVAELQMGDLVYLEDQAEALAELARDQVLQVRVTLEVELLHLEDQKVVVVVVVQAHQEVMDLLLKVGMEEQVPLTL
jgi:uncharacterized protein Smg (DUF494 family)